MLYLLVGGLAFIAGGFCGVVTMALCVLSRNIEISVEEHLKEMEQDEQED